MRDELLVVSLVMALLVVLLVVLAMRGRWRRGLGTGRTVSLDNVTLYSERLKLVGRPDRLVRQGETLIPEEWKSSNRVSEAHTLQLGTYFLLIEDEFGVSPPYGVIVLGDGSRVEIQNTEDLRSRVLGIAERIREHRRTIRKEIRVRQPPAKCRACGQRSNCAQARD